MFDQFKKCFFITILMCALSYSNAQAHNNNRFMTCSDSTKDTSLQGWYERHPLPLATSGRAIFLPSEGHILFFGGEYHQQSSRLWKKISALPIWGNTWAYDIHSDCWSELTLMPVSRSKHTATRLADGRIFITGGEIVVRNQPSTLHDQTQTTSSVAIYDPQNDQWRQAPSMELARAEHSAFLLADGRILITQNIPYYISNSQKINETLEIYSPQSNTWQSVHVPYLQNVRYMIVHLPKSHQVLWFPHYQKPSEPSELDESNNNIISYDYLHDLWQELDTAKRIPRYQLDSITTLVLPENKVIFIGGGDFMASNSVTMYS